MPSKTDFNVSPYYDDFNKDKNFHRVMYRPGYAVQARELTAQQSLLQNQIEQMGNHLFKQGSMVIPGKATLDTNYLGLRLTSFTGTLANFNGTTITGGTSGVKAKIIGYDAADGTDPATLYLKYTTAGTDNTRQTFQQTETVTSDASTGETAVVDSSTFGVAVRTNPGVFYINGYFVQTTAETLVLEKYTNIANIRVDI